MDLKNKIHNSKYMYMFTCRLIWTMYLIIVHSLATYSFQKSQRCPSNPNHIDPNIHVLLQWDYPLSSFIIIVAIAIHIMNYSINYMYFFHLFIILVTLILIYEASSHLRYSLLFHSFPLYSPNWASLVWWWAESVGEAKSTCVQMYCIKLPNGWGNLLTCIPVGVWVGKRVSEDSGVPPTEEEAFAWYLRNCTRDKII